MATRVKPQDKMVTANGLNLHYLDWGTVGKPVVLLLHGVRGHAHSWDDVSAALCQDFHILALDQRGRGDSDWAPGGDYSLDAFVADLAGFCEAVGLESFVLFGHSMGGRNSIAFAARYSKKVEKLVIVDVGPVIEPAGGARVKQQLGEQPEEFDSFEAVVAYRSKQDRFASDAVIRRRLQYESKELPNGKFGWRYDLAIREQFRQGTMAPAVDLWPELRKISCPTLVVRGPHTDILSVETAQQMLEILAQGQLVEAQQAGHMVFEDNPEGFMAAVSSFLR